MLADKPGNPARRARLLDFDPSLLPRADAGARRHLTAPLIWIRRGAWTVPAAAQRHQGRWLGLLIIDGLLIRTVRVSELECCELLGPGDVIRPWQADDDLASFAAEASWRALQETRVAVLDDTFTRIACRWPGVLAELMERGLRRSRALTVQLAIAQARSANVRLIALFWHLADRWGRVTHDGVLVELDLTHRVLSRLTCLRRPTVSLTLKQLEASGELSRLSRSRWLLRGVRPSDHRPALGRLVA